MAAAWLSKNTKNRSLSAGRVEQYARDMSQGKWKMTHQGIAFNGNGTLVDGQHRLAAIVKAGKPIKMMVVEGVEGDANEFIDRGRARSFSDTLKMRGVKYTTQVSAACRTILILDRGIMQPSDAERDAIFKSRVFSPSLTWLSEVCCVGMSGADPRKAAAYYGPLTWAHRYFPSECEAFNASVRTGDGLRAKSPELMLRDYLMRQHAAPRSMRAHSWDTAGKVLSCIALSISGKKVSKLIPGSKRNEQTQILQCEFFSHWSFGDCCGRLVCSRLFRWSRVYVLPTQARNREHHWRVGFFQKYESNSK
jgi:hypothetical protein